MGKSRGFRGGLRTPPLTKYIKGILEQYPDDGQILKELIQNADDAGAQTVRFLLDEGQYESSPEGLIHPDMAQFQGPSLLVYNDAVFSEEDWDGICRMEESIKEKDVIQTGRFGLGFKSIFHITDLPIIASGDCIGIIDPHQKYLPERASAWDWHLGDEKDFIQSKEDQFRPLFKGIFGLDADILSNAGRYNHTAFRFPLRREANQLSSIIYTAEKVLQLFRSLEVDEGQTLLFLKSVQSIEIYHQSQAVGEPRLLYRMTIAENSAKQVSETRKAFLEKVRQKEWRSKPIETILEMTVQVEHFRSGGTLLETHDWLVYHTCHRDKAAIDAADELKVLPWIGIALPISKFTDLKNQIREPAGHLFATLPLPLDGTERTGLAFHVHAYFAMEQNRRHLRWPTPDQNQESSDTKIKWNQLLVSQCIPAVVVAFFRQVICSGDSGISITPDSLYELLPNEDSVDAKWRPLVSHIYKELFTERCLYSPAKDKGWLKVEDTIQSDDHLPDKVNKLLKRVLLTAGFPITNVPPHIQAAVKKYSLKQQDTISAHDVHNAILKVTKNGNRLEREDALLLLQYFLDNGQPQDLIGLPLLPLMSGEMASFQEGQGSSPIFLSSKEHPAALLPGLEQRLVDTNLPDQLLASLMTLSKTGATQLKGLSFKDTIKSLADVLPSTWAEFDVVHWSTDDRAHPSLTWLEQIWDYIHLNSPSIQEWQILENLHLLPIDNCQTLCKFSVGKRTILSQTEENTLRTGVIDFLLEVGCIVLRKCPDFVYKHKDLLYHSVHLPTCPGITEALMSVSHQSGEMFIEKIKQFWSCRKSSLCEFVSYMSDSGIRLLSSKSKKFLLGLPLFSTVSGSGFQLSKNVSLSEIHFSNPSLELPVPFPVPVIDVSNEKVKYMIEALDVCKYHQDSFPQVLKEVLLPAVKLRRYTNEQADHLLCHIMDHHPKIILDNMAIAAEIAEVALVETNMQEMKSPKELYNPRAPFLPSLLGREFFPHDKYHTSDRLACLEKLGLRPLKQVTSDDFLQIAKSLSTDPGRADDFIQLTKTLSEQAPLGKWWEKLRDVAFLRVVQEKPDGYPNHLPWKGSTVKLLAPKVICHIKFAKQAGSSVPFVDLDESILAVLQAKIIPSLSDIVIQLKHVTEHYNTKEKSCYLAVLDEVYSGMAQFTENEIQDSLDHHSVSSWIWYGNGFKCKGQMLLEDPEIKLSPYYYTLPPEMEMHKDLLHSCGVPNTVHFEKVLEDIAEKQTKEESQNASTTAHDLQLANNLLMILCKQGAKTALVPIETPGASKLQFKPALECTIWDDSSEFNDDDDIFYVHPLVPKEIVTHFCIPTVMHRVLDGEEFNITLESFGQNEPLTTRLHSVLDGYTDGLAVLKEMVQNADDAGATEVRLIYDMRENKDWKKSLLDPNMADWQGPAMWVYNNAIFTDEDFTNITKLNGATKREKEDQIGTFGLGFNAVYNLTDVPSIFSRDTLAIFDPHTTYLGRAIRDKSKPGLRINLGRGKAKLLSKYPDQFAPWKGVCGCHLGSDSDNRSFDGTLFRLPLRGHKQSTFSKISDIVYDERNVLELLKMVHMKGNNMLLFTQNVLKVSVSVIPREVNGTDVQMKDLFEIHKEPVQYLHKHGIQCDMSCPSQAENLSVQTFINECSILKASVSSTSKDGKGRGLKSSMIIKSIVETSDEGKLLLGESFSHSEPHTYWIVSQSIEDMPFVQDASTKQQPVAGIAICLEKESDHYKLKPQDNSTDTLKASYFSFLPLPVKSPLPFHINGTFILDQSRRHLVQKTEHDKNLAGGAWNKGLIEGAVCTAYMTALSDIISLTAPDEDLSTILPVNMKHDLITSMSETFWKRVIQDSERLAIFLGPQGRVSMNDAYFLDQSIGQSCQDNENIFIKVISMVFQGSGRTLVELPLQLKQTLQEVDSEMLTSKLITKEIFLSDYFLPNMASLSLEQSDRDDLLVQALKSKSCLVENTFKSKPCIPVSPCGQRLVFPKDLIHPCGKAAKLYNSDEAKFPAFRCDCGNDRTIVYNKLCTLGMIKDNVNWQEVVNRAAFFARIGPITNFRNVQNFLDYLRWKLGEENDKIPNDIKQALRKQKFLPSLEKPRDWDLKWKGQDCPSYSGYQLFFIMEPLIACTQLPIFPRNLHLSPDVSRLLGINGKGTGYPISIETIKMQVDEITSHKESCKNQSVRDSLHKIYKHLDAECIDLNKAKKISQMFSNKCFLLVGNQNEQKLVFPESCAFQSNIDAYPYLNRVTWKHKRLYKCVGVKDYFTCEKLIATIALIEKEFDGKPLDDRTIILVNTILEELSESHENIQELVGEKINCIPDSMGVLRPVEALCYNESRRPTIDFPLVHSCISNYVAASLGVKELREYALCKRSHGIAYVKETNIVEEIHSVQEAYPCSVQILMELMLQADDAGATEIHFKLDPRNHGINTIFGEGWKTMQGPSLCVENDAKINRHALAGLFLPEDNNTNSHSAGIQSVYHLTDTPTVLATLNDGTETLCAYDPTCQYVQGTSQQEPGMMYEDVPLLGQFFPDVFECYRHKEFGSAGPGTHFRFPLRTPDAAKNYTISKSVSVEKVDAMLRDLSEEASQALVFMTSLRRICITRLNAKTGKFVTDVVTSTITQNESEVHDIRHYIQLLKQNGSSRMSPLKSATYVIKVKGPCGKEQEWSVYQQCGPRNSCLGRQKSPIGGVAKLRCTTRPEPVRKNLLLPWFESTELPVAIFGMFKHTPKMTPYSQADHNWNDAISQIIAAAYVQFIKAEVELLSSKPLVLIRDYVIREYFRKFPEVEGYGLSMCALIVKQFYKLLKDEPVLPLRSPYHDGQNWLKPTEAYFLQESHGMEDENEVIKGATVCGLKIVKCPHPVQTLIKKFCCCKLSYLSPDGLMDYLHMPQQYSITELKKLVETKSSQSKGISIVKAMLTFCNGDKLFSRKLDRLPLLVTSDGQLRTFDRRTPVYKSSDLRLLKPHSAKFLHLDFVDIFQDIESSVFKALDIETFCKELERNFPHLAQNRVIPLARDTQTSLFSDIWKAIDRIVGENVNLLKQYASHLSLWVTVKGNRKYLYPISEMHKVFQKRETWNVNSSTEHLYFTWINWGDIPVSEIKSLAADNIVASFDRPKTVLHALHTYQKESNAIHAIFKDAKLLKYFQSKNSGFTTEDNQLMRELPMFETLTKQYVNLAERYVYIIPSEVPMIDMDAWTNTKHGILFLKEKPEFKNLYSDVGCVFWSIEDLYIKYIFQHLEWLSEEGHKVHMHYVLDKLGMNPNVTKAMRTIECVSNITGDHCLPCELYDPTISLFKYMQFQNLPAEDLSTEHRLKVLRKAGMTSTATKEMLAIYATRLPIQKNAHLIFEYIKNHINQDTQIEYMKHLSDIAFISRKESGNGSICPDSSDEPYVALRGSVIVGHSGLAWAVAPLINDLQIKFDQNVLAAAGVITMPSGELVARNIVRVCENCSSDQTISIEFRRKLSGLLDSCYNYISTKLENDECTEQEKKRLQEIMSDHCCVPVVQAGLFVKPNQVVLNVEPGEEIKPYLYRLPDNLICSKEVLKLLGLVNKTTIRTYQRVLSMVHDKFHSHAINSDEDIQAAKQATRQVFKRIKRDRSLDLHSDLWLLSKTNRLHRSQSIIYSNNVGIERKLKQNDTLLVDINLRVSIESILEYFPGTHRPQLLTSVVKEEVQHKGNSPTQSSNEVREHLSSEVMANGLQRLTHHIMVTNTQEDIDDTIHDKIAEVQNLMQKIQIRSVDNLKTQLNSHFGIIGDWQRKMFFAEWDTSVFYLDRSSLEKTSDCFYMYIMLADMVNDLNKGFFREHMKILMILLSTDPERIGQRLDEMGILPYSP